MQSIESAISDQIHGVQESIHPHPAHPRKQTTRNVSTLQGLAGVWSGPATQPVATLSRHNASFSSENGQHVIFKFIPNTPSTGKSTVQGNQVKTSLVTAPLTTPGIHLVNLSSSLLVLRDRSITGIWSCRSVRTASGQSQVWSLGSNGWEQRSFFVFFL